MLRGFYEQRPSTPHPAAAAARLLAAAEAAVLRALRRREARRRARLGAQHRGALGQDAEVEVLDRLDLVAQHRRALEVQLLGLGVHLRLELRDELGNVALVLGEIPGELLLAGQRVVRVGGDAVYLHVEDGPVDALGRAPVRGVVCYLLRAA